MAQLYTPKALPPQLDAVFNLMAELPFTHVFCVGGAARDADNGFPIRDYDIFATHPEGQAYYELQLRQAIEGKLRYQKFPDRYEFDYAGVVVDLAVFRTPNQISKLLDYSPVGASAIAIEMSTRQVWVRYDYESDCAAQVIRLSEAWDDAEGRAYATKLHAKTGWEVRGRYGRLITPKHI
jgi:hypothetical protein